MFGGAGFGMANGEYINEQRKNGTYVTAYSLSGADYVVSWPMPWEENNFLLGTGIYAASQ